MSSSLAWSRSPTSASAWNAVSHAELILLPMGPCHDPLSRRIAKRTDSAFQPATFVAVSTTSVAVPGAIARSKRHEDRRESEAQAETPRGK